MNRQAWLTVALSLLASGALGPAARAAVTVYTSQAAFDAAFPTAQKITFDSLNPGPDGAVLAGRTVTVGGDTFTMTSPFGNLLALPSGNPGAFGDYGEGVVFLSAQTFGDPLDLLQIKVPAAKAFGFDYGDYALLGASLSVTVNGQTFANLGGVDTPSFIGFSSTTPIEDVLLTMPIQPDYDFAVMDVIDVSQVPISPTPEPGAWALLLFGTGLLGAWLRRRRAGRPLPA